LEAQSVPDLNYPETQFTMPEGKNSSSPIAAEVPLLGSGRLALRRRWRHFTDKFAAIGIAVGGISVIAAILLIFAYLAYEIAPLFEGAEVEATAQYSLEIVLLAFMWRSKSSQKWQCVWVKTAWLASLTWPVVKKLLRFPWDFLRAPK
jgi:hypothetical protein